MGEADEGDTSLKKGAKLVFKDWKVGFASKVRGGCREKSLTVSPVYVDSHAHLPADVHQLLSVILLLLSSDRQVAGIRHQHDSLAHRTALPIRIFLLGGRRVFLVAFRRERFPHCCAHGEYPCSNSCTLNSHVQTLLCDKAIACIGNIIVIVLPKSNFAGRYVAMFMLCLGSYCAFNRKSEGWLCRFVSRAHSNLNGSVFRLGHVDHPASESQACGRALPSQRARQCVPLLLAVLFYARRTSRRPQRWYRPRRFLHHGLMHRHHHQVHAQGPKPKDGASRRGRQALHWRIGRCSQGLPVHCIG